MFELSNLLLQLLILGTDAHLTFLKHVSVGSHQEAFVKVRVLLTALQLTLLGAQDEWSLWNCSACGSRFLHAFSISAAQLHPVGVRSQWMKVSLQHPWAMQTRGNDNRPYSLGLC